MTADTKQDLPRPLYSDRPKIHILVLLCFLFPLVSFSFPLLPLDLRDRKGIAILSPREMVGDYGVRLLRETEKRQLKGECLDEMELK